MLRLSPRPFFRYSRVVVACAMMLPPMGFTEGPANMLPPSRLAATTWHSANQARNEKGWNLFRQGSTAEQRRRKTCVPAC